MSTSSGWCRNESGALNEFRCSFAVGQRQSEYDSDLFSRVGRGEHCRFANYWRQLNGLSSCSERAMQE